MVLFNSLPPDVQAFLVSVAGDGLANLASEYASALIGAASRRVRTTFGEDDEVTAALRNAANASIVAVVKDWAVLPEEYAAIWENAHGWLLEPIVLGEFRKLRKIRSLSGVLVSGVPEKGQKGDRLTELWHTLELVRGSCGFDALRRVTSSPFLLQSL